MSTKKSTQTQVTTPNVPDYIQGPMKTLYGQVGDQAGVDPHSLVAGMDPLQSLATGGAAALGNGSDGGAQAKSWLNQVVNGSVGGAGASSGQWGDVNKYLDPALNFELNSSLNSFDNQAAQDRTSQSLGLAGRRGGSGADIATSLLGGQQSLARGQLEGGIRSHAFDLASQLADAQAGRDSQANMQAAQLASSERMADANNKLQASSLYSDIGNNADANSRANLALQSDIGGINRGINQQDLSAPSDYLAKLSAILGGLPGQMDVGQTSTGTTKTSGGGLSSALGLAALVAAPFTGGASLGMMGMGGLSGMFGGGGGSALPAGWTGA